MTTVAIVCSPNMGIVDSWLPVISAARERHPDWTFVALVPRAWAMGIRSEAAALRAADRLLDEVIVEAMPGDHRRLASLRDADRDERWRSSVVDLVRRADAGLAVRGLTRGSPGHGRGGPFERVLRRVSPLLTGGTRRPFRHPLGSTIVLADIDFERRTEALDIAAPFGDAPVLVLSHGLGYLPSAARPATDPSGRTRIACAYAYSEAHADHLAADLGLPRERVHVTGVPRHDPDVHLPYVTSAPAPQDRPTADVLLISRPATSPHDAPGGSPIDWLPMGRKITLLRAIHRVVCEELGLRLVVTRHPKEREERSLREGLPADGEGRTWWLSEEHPLDLAPGLRFAVSFSSGVAVDLLTAGVATIELQDVTGASAYDGPDALRDGEGRILRTSERRHGLVLPADDEDDLRRQVASILAAPVETLEGLRAAYRTHYADPTGAVARILADIELLAEGRGSTPGGRGTDH